MFKISKAWLMLHSKSQLCNIVQKQYNQIHGLLKKIEVMQNNNEALSDHRHNNLKKIEELQIKLSSLEYQKGKLETEKERFRLFNCPIVERDGKLYVGGEGEQWKIK